MVKSHALWACLGTLFLFGCQKASNTEPPRLADASASPGAGGQVDAGKAPDGGRDGAQDAALDAASLPSDEAQDAAAPAPDAPSADAGEAQDPGDPALPPRCPAGETFPDPLPPEGERRARLRASGFNFVEGPVWVADQGALFFSDMDFSTQDAQGVASRIHRYVPGEGARVFVPDAGSNGLALTPDGALLACTHDQQTLSRFDPETGQRTTRDLTYMGDRFNSPNDLVVRSDGHVYFTDPDWQLPPRTSETGITGVYHVDPAGEVSLVDGSLDKPNGIALSPDERTLYVGSYGPDVLAYAVADDGSVGEPEIFASPGASDGMGVDCAGNLYVTAQDVVVYDPAGQELGRIEVAESPTNVAFGGADRHTLYITAQTGLYALTLRVPGLPY